MKEMGNINENTALLQDSKCDQNNTPQKVSPTRKYIIGCMFLIMKNIANVSGTITLQMSLGSVTVFEILLVPCFCVMLFAYFVSWRNGDSVLPKQKHVHWFILICLFNYITVIFFCASTALLTVGNLYAIFISGTLMASVVVDVVKKEAKRTNIIAGLLGCVGVILVISPWNHQSTEGNISCAPCQILDSYWSPYRYDNISQVVNSPNISQVEITNGVLCPAVTERQSSGSNTLDLNIISGKYGSYVGYFTVCVAITTTVINANIIRKVSCIYSSAVIAFWTMLTAFFVSLIIVFAIHGLNWPLPVEKACQLSTAALLISDFFKWIPIFYLYRYLAVSHVQIGQLPTPIILYISQRTFLQTIFPAPGGILETVGVGVVLLAVTFLPLVKIVQQIKMTKAKNATEEVNVQSE